MERGGEERREGGGERRDKGERGRERGVVCRRERRLKGIFVVEKGREEEEKERKRNWHRITRPENILTLFFCWPFLSFFLFLVGVVGVV